VNTQHKSGHHFRSAANQIKTIGNDLSQIEDNSDTEASFSVAMLCLEEACLALLPDMGVSHDKALQYAITARSMRLVMQIPLRSDAAYRASSIEIEDIAAWIEPAELKAAAQRGLRFSASIGPLLLRAEACEDFRAVLLEDILSQYVPCALQNTPAWAYDHTYRLAGPHIVADALTTQVRHFPDQMSRALAYCLSHNATPIPSVALALAGAQYDPSLDGGKPSRHPSVEAVISDLKARLVSNHGSLKVHETYGTLTDYLSRLTRSPAPEKPKSTWRMPPADIA
jgi:hypothetical protein